MKLSYEDKIEIYNEWKIGHKSPERIARERNLAGTLVKYMVRLADLHGPEALEHKYHYYSPEYKEEAIKRVLTGNEAATQVSLDLGLPNIGTLPNWIKEYIENGYTVIERKRGRHAKEEDNGRTSSGERGTAAAERSASPDESRAYDTGRIRKKIRRLGFGKREIRIEEIAAAVTELRQEVKRSVGFILNAINSDPELPNITRSTYYYTIRKTDKDFKNDSVMNEIIAIYYDHKERYGYRRITLELKKRGHRINVKAVRRLMRRMGLYGLQRKKGKYSSYKGTVGTIADNIIKRDFYADQPNQKWYSDVTEFNLRGEKTYLSPILDGCGGDIVSFVISRSPNLWQTMEMLKIAFAKHPKVNGLILHTDQGWQYQHTSYVQELKDHGVVQSMSRKGNSMDNGLMENFFGLLKTEMFYGQEARYNTLDDLEAAISDYIYYYNHQRIKERLKGLTPLEWREMRSLVQI